MKFSEKLESKSSYHFPNSWWVRGGKLLNTCHLKKFQKNTRSDIKIQNMICHIPFSESVSIKFFSHQSEYTLSFCWMYIKSNQNNSKADKYLQLSGWWIIKVIRIRMLLVGYLDHKQASGWSQMTHIYTNTSNFNLASFVCSTTFGL